MARNKRVNKAEKKCIIKKQKIKKTTPDDHATINEETNSLESLTPEEREEKDRTDIEKDQVLVHEASKVKKNIEQKKKKRMLNESDNVIKEKKSPESSTLKKTFDIIDNKSEEDVAHISEGTKNKRSKKSENNTPVNNKNKSVVDEIIAVPIKSKKQKRNLNPEEAAVTEEDIDKFCEELDEEDNVQYENWVKLIEANFNNKNKTS